MRRAGVQGLPFVGAATRWRCCTTSGFLGTGFLSEASGDAGEGADEGPRGFGALGGGKEGTRGRAAKDRDSSQAL
jgi:hypothetical protein